ncbi:MAG: histidine kinase [Gammaproteobacteria bacterium]|nr:histidine kinase [Gammaproteobacteria bacterium]NNJ97690.1 histidine kinase [Gammaproteobacteria bacterium]
MEKQQFSDGISNDIGLLPDFCDVRIIFMLVLIVELLAMVLSMAIPSTTEQFWDILAFVSMMMQWIALLNAALLCLSRRTLNRLSAPLTMIISFTIMMVVTLVFALILIRLNLWMQLDEYTSPLGEHFLLRVLLMSGTIYAIVLRYFYIQQQWKLNLKAQSRAELQALKARIRPHFLFNSMNTIASLISFMPDKAEKAVEDLSDLFRASLKEQNIHTLKNELDITRSYLDIEKLRLGDRLQIDWNIDKSLFDEEIPALSLQPLAENAIYHGIEPLPDGGRVGISAQREGDGLTLTVSNPVSESAVVSHSSGNRMAQDNIEQRLRLAYGNNAHFKINATNRNYTVTLELPVT